jgi:hypothetical protein
MVLAAAPAAFAKGPMAQTTGRVVITGPGLSKPILEAWQGSCFELQDFACSNATMGRIDQAVAAGTLGKVKGGFWTVFSATGAASMANGYHGQTFAPPKGARLGPRYDVTYVVSMAGMKQSMDGVSFADGRSSGVTQMFHQVLYPWAPSPYTIGGTGPLIYTPAGQSLLGQNIGAGWWPADPTFFQFLTSHGLPATAPPVGPAANPAPVNPPPVPQPPALPGWPLWLGVALLLGMVAAAVLAGRRVAGARPAAA